MKVTYIKMAKIRCPADNLTEMVKRLAPLVFDNLDAQIKTGEVIRSKRKKKRDRITERALECVDEKDFDEDILYYDKLREYGETREEMITNIGRHVKDCPVCYDEYIVFLHADAITDINLHRKNAFRVSEDVEQTARNLDFSAYLRIGIE